MSPSPKKISGIILAAGTGSRMGETKQLMPFGETTILGRVIQTVRESAIDEIIIVLGHDADEISNRIDLSGITAVRNTQYNNGQSTSLIKGLEALSSGCDAAMFILGDQPLITTAIINRMVDVYQTADAMILIPYCNGKRGNPVIIARPLFTYLRSLTGDTGARTLFEKFKHGVLELPIDDESILFDVDTRKDYEDLISKEMPSRI